MKKMNWQSPFWQRTLSGLWLVWVAILAYFLAVLFWQLYPLPKQTVSTELVVLQPVSSNKQGVNSAQSQANKINNAAMFGVEKKQPKPVENKPKPKPKLSKLPFKIIATAASSDPKIGLVTLSDKGKSKTFKIIRGE